MSLNKTLIEWVKNPDGTPGYTFNPITGCLNHVNGLCKGGGFPCYAYRLANGRLKHLYLANTNFMNPKSGSLQQACDNLFTPLADPFYPRFWPERLEEPTKGYRYQDYGGANASASDKGIFVCDMSDLFGIGVPEEWTRRVLDVIKRCYYHRFYLLTKQPQNLIKFSPFPDNCWVGVTATNRDMFNNAVWHLMSIEANVKYISIEPLLSPITAGILDTYHNWPVVNGSILSHVLDWLIIGAQTKPSVFPKIEWVKEIVEAADKAGIPVFLKDNLAPMLPNARIGLPFFYKPKRIEDTDHEFQWLLRQEMPQ